MRNGAGDPSTRKGKFIAVANMKGGVGKTTTVVSLAEALAADDASAKILVIDLDPQASASVAVAGDEQLDELIENERTLEAFLEKRLIAKTKASLANSIHPTICATFHRGEQLSVALLPCGPRLRTVERELLYELAKANNSFFASDGQILRLFKSDILPLAETYDFILFDCAPGISPVTEIAIRLSDLVIVPTVPDRLSVYGLNAFYENIWQIRTRTLPEPKSKPNILVVRMHQATGRSLQRAALCRRRPWSGLRDAGCADPHVGGPRQCLDDAGLPDLCAEVHATGDQQHTRSARRGSERPALMSSMVVNGAAILSAMAQKSADFSFNDAQINDLAMSILVTKLKDKELKVEQLRRMAAAVGESDFKLVLEHLASKDALALVKRLDAKNPELKGADESWARHRASSLILGGADPSAPAPKAKAPARSTGSKTGKALQSKALKPRAPKKGGAQKEAE